AVLNFLTIPVSWISTKGVRQFLPHKRSVHANGRLRKIEQCRTTSPHDWWRDGSAFVMAHDFKKLADIFQTENHHERLLKMRMLLGSLVVRSLPQIQVESKERSERVVLEVAGFLLPVVRHRAVI